MERVCPRLQRASGLDDAASLDQRDVTLDGAFTHSQVEWQVDCVGEPMLIRETAETGHQVGIRQIAAVFVGLEEYKLDIVYERSEILDVGQYLVGDDV